MKRQTVSAPLAFLILAALSLGASVAGNLLPVMAQQFPSAQPYQAPGAYSQTPPYKGQAAVPITGNVYQNQAGMSQASVPDNVMIILDASDSMADGINGRGGEPKMNAAKRTVLEVIRNLPANTRVGLRVYGTSANAFTACHATQVLVPLGENNRNLIGSKIIGVRPTGMTPISYTVERSLREDFQGVNGTRSIILISDGAETCGEDPCNIAVRMQQYGVNVRINVVGLGLSDYLATKQLRCVALATKGQFYTANTAAELANAMNKAMAVETKVQGTILTPSASAGGSAVEMPPAGQQDDQSFRTRPPGQQAGQTFQTRPPEEVNLKKTYQEKELPAAVPIRDKKR